MPSGYNLQGIIRRSSINALTQFERMGYYSENISNWSTNAYKATRFEEILGENGYAKGVIRTDHAQGSVQVTKRELDVALSGAGFIPVTSPSGEIYYTRDGSFCLGKDGILMTQGGDIVGSGIKISAQSVKTQINKNGDVFAYKDLSLEPEYIGNIPIVTFDNPEGLKEVGDNKYVKTEISGDEQLLVDHTRISQYSLERSNVDLFDQVNQVMRVNASLLASTTLLGAVNSMYEDAIDIRS
ncbi:MAG: flagellar hook basal-body protein [Candidatus Gastranaerophilales bacterium]|nr:flagellar hook basal-body protein [Candidatus Gastranaerophilales bacterium]